ncbi:MAG: LptF/LptG family permease [Oligoflexus sp.]|nr:LptF/LptG family permease [Oligoflexus sp.]
MIPQFVTVFCILSAVIVISQLVRLSEILVTFGLSVENLFLPFLFILMPFVSIIVPIALLFAVLLGFSRLSADGEYSAMMAAGYSLKRAMIPVLFVATAAYAIAVMSSVYFESWGRRETLKFYHRKAQTELDNMIKYRMKEGVFQDDFLGYVLYAEKISSDRSHLENVMLAPGRDSQKEHFTLLAPAASIDGSVEAGDLRMTFTYGIIYTAQPSSSEVSIMKFKKLDLDLLRIFRDQVFGPDSEEDDYRNFGPLDLWNYIQKMQASTEPRDHDTYLKARFLFHQRFGMPFACFAFALLAMVFGIQDERKGKSHAYLLSSLVIVLGYILIMTFKYWAEKDLISAPLGAWAPQFIMLGFAIFLVYQRNRLPPSESVFDLRHIPILNRLKRKHAK